MVTQRYRLGQMIGQGGMAVVHLAYDTHEQRSVAIKIMKLKGDEGGKKTYERFMHEIRIARKLSHHHILPVFDSGKIEYGGSVLPYLTSQYMPDGSLEKFADKEASWLHWPLSQIADIVWQAAQALMYMHTRERPLVHRDVKPGNFLIRVERLPGRIAHIYLSDFGIAREERPTSNLASEAIGTEQFMSPEQIERQLKCATDQYALAIMACWLLTGEYPLRSHYMAHLRDAPTPPSVLSPNRIHSSEIDAIILKALAKNKRHRFPTILQFAQELSRAIMRQEAGTFQTQTVSAESPTFHASPTIADNSLLPRLSPQIDFSEHEELDVSLPANHPLVRGSRVKATSKAVPTIPLKKLFHKELPARPSMLAWAPDGNSFICTFDGPEAPRFISRDGKVGVLHTFVSGHLACWSPDGHYLAVSSLDGSNTQRKIQLWDMAARAEWPSTLLFQGKTPIDGLDWSRGGDLALWVDDQIQLYNSPQLLVIVQQQKLRPKILATQDMHCGNIGTLRWSPDGALLAAGTLNGAVLCWHVETLQLQWQEPPSGRRVYSLAWSPDSSSLAVGFQNRRVAIWNVRERRILRTWDKLSRIPHMLNISPLQDMVVVATKQGLLFGNVRDDSPSLRHPGQFLATWSPTRPELATLDAHDETTLVLWEKV